MEEHQRRPGIGLAGVVGSEPSEGPDDGLAVRVCLHSADLHVVPFVF